MRCPEPVFLTGFSGAGKSSVGRSLARNLRVNLYDIDQIITRKTGRSIGDIFRRDGQAAFRELERKTIGELIERMPNSAVVALGGGALQDSLNRKLILSSGTVIYLSCSQRELYRRLRHMTDRPLLMADNSGSRVTSRVLKSRIKSMLEKRVRYYRLADIQQSTTGRSTAETVREVKRKLGRYYAKS